MIILPPSCWIESYQWKPYRPEWNKVFFITGLHCLQAANNQAVCAHYIGQMDESLRILEALTTPAHYQQQQMKIVEGGTASQSLSEGLALHDAIVSNLSTLLDAESDLATARKMSLLERIAVVPGDRVALTAFKLKLA